MLNILKQLKEELTKLLEIPIEFRHIGSTALGIEGRKDIDLEVLIDEKDYEQSFNKMVDKYGPQKKSKGKYWNKFETIIEDYDIDIFLSTTSDEQTINNKLYFDYMRENPDARNNYLNIKNQAKSKSKEDYLKAKENFYWAIVAKAKLE